jgi:hypothetical protein
MPDDLIRGRMIPAHLRPDPRPLRLWHYTCADSAPLIEQVGVLVPNPAARRSGSEACTSPATAPRTGSRCSTRTCSSRGRATPAGRYAPGSSTAPCGSCSTARRAGSPVIGGSRPRLSGLAAPTVG